MKFERLGNITTITSGGTPLTSKREYYDNGTIPWVKTGDLKVKDLSEISDCITQLGLENSSAKIFPVNTVLVAMYGATIGACSILKKQAATNQACAAILPNENLTPDYLFFYLSSIKKELISKGIGGGQPNISGAILKDTKIYLPSLNQQIHIANILTKAETLIQERKQSIALLDEFLKSTFLEMFGDPVKNEKGWKKDKIGNKCKVTKLAGYEYSKHIKYLDEGEIIAVKGLNVKKGKLKLDNISYIDKDISNYLIRSKLFKGDVAMTYIGINIGDVAIIEEDDKYHLAPNVSKITPMDFKEINSYYLLHYLMYNKWLFVRGTTDTAKPALNMGEIREIQITIPSINLQNKYESVVKKIDTLKQQYQQSLQQLQQLFGSLSQQAFRGELVNLASIKE